MSDSADNGNRTTRIREVVDECTLRWLAGEEVNEAEVVEAHPDLLPELAEEIKRIRNLVDEARGSVGKDDPYRTVDLSADSATHQVLHIRCPHCRNPV